LGFQVVKNIFSTGFALQQKMVMLSSASHTAFSPHCCAIFVLFLI